LFNGHFHQDLFLLLQENGDEVEIGVSIGFPSDKILLKRLLTY
jgi:hypothetical protein